MSTTTLPGQSMKVGRAYFIRTCTYHSLGRVYEVLPGEVVLERASWIPDSGQWHKTLAEGVDNIVEMEPYPGYCYVARQAIVDYTEWCHDLPTEPR